MYIDTHAHLNYPEKYGDLPQLLAKIAAAGVDTVINVGWDQASSALAAEQAERFAARQTGNTAAAPENTAAQAEHSAAEGLAAEAPTAAPPERFAAETPTATSAGCPALYFAAGFHPSNLQDYQTGDEERLASLLQSPKGVAVGEIGLDYHYEDTDEAAQKRAFCAQLELAEALSLPVIIHSRDAAADTLRILKDNRAKLRAGGVMHCFSGSPETAKEYLKLGLYISFAGPVTFKNARRLDEVAKIVPPERILAETDSPYLAPEPFRGTLNTPKNVVQVYEKLAPLRGEETEALALRIKQNAKTLFYKIR